MFITVSTQFILITLRAELAVSLSDKSVGSILIGSEPIGYDNHIFMSSLFLLWLFHGKMLKERILSKYLKIILISSFPHVFQKQITYWILFWGISCGFINPFSCNLDQPSLILFWDTSRLSEILLYLQKCELGRSQQRESKCVLSGHRIQMLLGSGWGLRVGIS